VDLLTIEHVLPFIAVGFAAQLVDGALGMAFGVISSTLLISLGVPPAAASAGVHAVETFTTAASGASHAAHRNIDWRLFWRLVIPGVLGAVAGAYVLTQIAAERARPFVLGYLVIISIMLIVRGLSAAPRLRPARVVEPLGAAGGFLDAAGGGGWGPIVTSNLLMQGEAPRQTIGTVSLSEFFVTVAVSLTFLTQMGLEVFTIATLGLLIGGLLAAPFGAVLAKRLKTQTLLVLVGTVLMATSLYGIWRAVYG